MAGRRYILEVYEPGSVQDVAGVFESDEPFVAIQVGDLINDRVWDTAPGTSTVLRVTAVEHVLWKNRTGGDVEQKLCIYTERVADTEELRVRRP